MADPVLFLPGLMADLRVFELPLRSLSHDRPVMVHMPVGADRVEHLASNLLNSAPKRFAMVAHGLGGFVALQAARSAPERVSAMVLICTTARPEAPANAAEMETHLVRAQSGGMFASIRSMTGVEALPIGAERRDIEHLQGEMALDLGEGLFSAQMRAIQRRPDQQPGLHRLKVPALVLAGELDPVYEPRGSEVMASLLPNARLEVIRGAGHMLPLELPRRLSELIRGFLPEPLLLE